MGENFLSLRQQIKKIASLVFQGRRSFESIGLTMRFVSEQNFQSEERRRRPKAPTSPTSARAPGAGMVKLPFPNCAVVVRATF